MSGGMVVTDQAFGNVSRERKLAAHLGVSFAEHQCRTDDEMVNAVAGARVVFVNFAPLTRRVLEAMEADAVLIRYGIGYDNVDISSASELGIRVCNVPDYGADTGVDFIAPQLNEFPLPACAVDRSESPP